MIAALAAVDHYFCSVEPSNPALLLVRQAQQLIGKSFLEVMQILIPEHITSPNSRSTRSIDTTSLSKGCRRSPFSTGCRPNTRPMPMSPSMTMP